MRTQTTIFPHRPRQSTRRNPVQDRLANEVAEAAYEIFRETTTVAYQAAQRAYPREVRERDANVRYAYEAAHDEAKSYLTHYKTLVRDAILPLVQLTKHNEPYDFHPLDFDLSGDGTPLTSAFEDKPTWQFRGMIVLNAFRMLHKKLSDWIPPMPQAEADRYIRQLDSCFEDGRERLLEFLSYYEADPVLTTDDNIRFVN